QKAPATVSKGIPETDIWVLAGGKLKRWNKDGSPLSSRPAKYDHLTTLPEKGVYICFRIGEKIDIYTQDGLCYYQYSFHESYSRSQIHLMEDCFAIYRDNGEVVSFPIPSIPVWP
ncbi:MAG: hypothetical protein AAGM67_16130, partial [Bacteroidota bacterium]